MHVLQVVQPKSRVTFDNPATSSSLSAGRTSPEMQLAHSTNVVRLSIVIELNKSI